MVESIIAWLIVAIAAVLVGRSLFRKVKGRATCSCDATCSCEVASSCQIEKKDCPQQSHNNPGKIEKIP